MDLAKVQPAGYQDNQDIMDNGGLVNGEISFQILKSSGFSLREFTWYQVYDESEGWQLGRWKETGGGWITEGQVTFNPGDGIWYDSELDDWDIENTILPSSGEAIVDSQTIVLTNGCQAIANPASFDIKLVADKVAFGGYQDNQDIMDNGGLVNGEISFQILKSTGFSAREFTWYQVYDESEGWQPGLWKETGGTWLSTDNDVTIKMGQSLWVDSELDDWDIEETTITFPGLNELAK